MGDIAKPLAEHAERERDSWKEGRREGAAHADAEIRRLQEGLDESKARARKLEGDLDSKGEEISALDRSKRTAELERDELVNKVRKAQTDVMARKALDCTDCS